MTREAREQYRLELPLGSTPKPLLPRSSKSYLGAEIIRNLRLYESPELFFEPNDFPHYIEVYGDAARAMLEQGEHITQALGSRSPRAMPPPFRDQSGGSENMNHGEKTVGNHENNTKTMENP